MSIRLSVSGFVSLIATVLGSASWVSPTMHAGTLQTVTGTSSGAYGSIIVIGNPVKPPTWSLNVNMTYSGPLVYRSKPLTQIDEIILPTLPENGPLEIQASESLGIPVKVVGKNEGVVRTYLWTDAFTWSPAQTNQPEGEVRLRWFWNDRRIPDIKGWLADGNQGKSGTYRVEVWQTSVASSGLITNLPRLEIKAVGGRAETSVWLGEKTFQVTVKDHSLLEEGAAPVLLEGQDFPASLVVAEGSSVTLRVTANSGAPFYYRWLKDDVEFSSSPAVTVSAKDCTNVGHTFRCEVISSTGTVSTPAVKVRLPRRPLVTFRTSSTFVGKVGSTLSLVPTVTSDTPVEIEWNGPAFEALNDRATVLENGTLQISDARLEDSAIYYCQVTNAEGTSPHRISILVPEPPAAVQPLRKDMRISILLKDPLPPGTYISTNWRFLDPETRGQISFPVPGNYVTDGSFLFLLKPEPQSAGFYRAQSTFFATTTEDTVSSSGLYQTITFRTSADLEFDFELTLPQQRPEMPVHALPSGQIGRIYSAVGPKREGANGPTHFAASGLPGGLKVRDDGLIEGYPIQSGVFKVRFTALNAKGSSAPLFIDLHIAPLPEGVAGEWLFAGPTYKGTHESERFTILPTGAYSGKKDGKAYRGSIAIDNSGDVFLTTIRIQPGTHYAQPNAGYRPEATGWRQTRGKPVAANALTGRFNFKADAPAPLPSNYRLGQQGISSGSVVIEASGLTTTTQISNDGTISISKAFLGPQREIMHEHRAPHPQKPLQTFWLKIDPEGNTLAGDFMCNLAYLDMGSSFAAYPQNNTLSAYSWPSLLWVRQAYKGARYLPPDPKGLPDGYDALATSNSSFCAGIFESPSKYHPFWQVIAAENQPAQLSANGSLTFPRPAPYTRVSTCKIHLPTGMISGTIKEPVSGTTRFNSLKYQGTLVPGSIQAEGYGTTLRQSGQMKNPDWGSSPVQLKPSGEL